MGRRAKCNCSPIDSAMEKYHNDIGNRLSGVFIPANSKPTNDQDPCDAFSMLTLDFRRSNSLRVPKTHPVNIGTDTTHLNKDSEHTDQRDLIPDHQKDDSAFDHRSDTLPSMYSHKHDISVKEKRNIMDKLARAIFQRKHTCARCQRRSKSCLQNKTFNVSEKHYMCGRCREASRTIKSLVSGKDHLSGLDSDEAKNNSDIIVPKPRVQLKDSGYETVTSCSTVASAHSNSISPYTSSTKPDKTTVTAAGVDPSAFDEELRRQDNTAPPCLNCPEQGHPTPHSNNANIAQKGLEQYLGGAGNDGVRVLKQVKTRNIQNYDGYLPTQQAPPYLCDLLAMSDTTSDETSSNTHHSNNSNSKPSPDGKICHICSTTSRPCFRLPWEGGWLCEECIDGML